MRYSLLPQGVDLLRFAPHDLPVEPDQLGAAELEAFQACVIAYADLTDPLNILLTLKQRISLHNQQIGQLCWLNEHVPLLPRPETSQLPSGLMGWGYNVAECGEKLRAHQLCAGGDQHGPLVLRFPSMTGNLSTEDWALYVQAVRLQAWRNWSDASAGRGDADGVSETTDIIYTQATRMQSANMHHLRSHHPTLFDIEGEADSMYERWGQNVRRAAARIE